MFPDTKIAKNMSIETTKSTMVLLILEADIKKSHCYV